MKAHVLARELTGAKIEKVSLVQHGANRTPFKLMKAADASQGAGDSAALDLRVAAHFGKKDAQPAKVTAVFVAKDADPSVTKALRAQGFTLTRDNVADAGTALVFKQEGFKEEEIGTLFALSRDVAIGVNQHVFDTATIAKGFESWHRGKTFEENLQTAGFYPCFYLGQDALCETLYQIMMDSRSPEEAAPLLEAALSGFKKWVMSLLKVLPVEVFKAEKELNADIGASKKTTTEVSKSDKGDSVKNKPVLKEAAPGDLDGLLDEPAAAAAAGAGKVTKSAEEVAAEEAAAAEAAAAEAAAAAAAAAGEGGEGGAPAAGDPAAAAAAGGTGDGAPAPVVKLDDVAALLVKTVEGVNVLVKAVGELKDRVAVVEKTAADATTVAKGAGEAAAAATTIAKNTVILGVDVGKLDEGLASLNGERTDIAKSAAAPEGGEGKGQKTDVFKGLLPMLEGYNHLG